jgi:hypothetical protein
MYDKQDYFANVPGELIPMCAGVSNNLFNIEIFDKDTIDTIKRLGSYENNIIPNSEKKNMRSIFDKIGSHSQVLNTLKSALFLTNKRLYGVFVAVKNITDLERQFLSTPFNLYDFCKRKENHNFIEHWFCHFNTGIVCLQADDTRLFGYGIHHKYRTESEENGEKLYLQHNYIRLDQTGELMVEFKKQYNDLNKANKNELWMRLCRLNRNENLTVDTFINLINELQKQCDVCNSSNDSKTFSQTNIACNCLFLIKTLKTIRTLLSSDQFLKLGLSQIIFQKVDQDGIEYLSRPFWIKVQLPVNAKVPLKFCCDLRLL